MLKFTISVVSLLAIAFLAVAGVTRDPFVRNSFREKVENVWLDLADRLKGTFKRVRSAAVGDG